MGLNLDIFCDKEMTSGEVRDIKMASKTTGACDQVFEMYSKDGCSVIDLDDIWQFMDKYSLVFGIIFIVIGIFVALFGHKMIKPTVFVISSSVSSLALLVTIYLLFIGTTETADWVNWLLLVICVILGLVAGFLMTKTIRLGVGILGGATGFAIGLMICSIFGVDSEIWFWIIVAAVAALFFGATFHKSDEVIMILTSLMGSYVWVRGVSIMIPNSYPNEIALVKDLSNGFQPLFPWTFWLYLVVMAASFVGGFWFQRKKHIENGSKSNHPYYAL